MQAFPTHDEESAPEDSRPLLAESRDRFGFLPNMLGGMAESPVLLQAYLQLKETFARSALTPLQQAVVLLAVSRHHACPYCVAAHSVGADRIEVPREITDAIRDDRPIPEPQLETLRRYAGQLVERHGEAEPAMVQAMLDAGFSRQQVLDVALGVAQKILSNFTNHLVGTELDEPLQSRAWQPPEGRAA